MPLEDRQRDEGTKKKDSATSTRKSGFFAIPPPLKRLFDQFPIIVYPANDLPLRAPRNRSRHALYIFADSTDSRALSFNPNCLKWQTYLRFCGIDYVSIPSSNHASPSGSLPFLLPAHYTSDAEPIVSGKLQKWTMQQSASAVDESEDARYEVYMSLLDSRVRRAWLHSLYLTSNFESIVTPLYVDATSKNSFVRVTTALSLRAAAKAELARQSPAINPEAIYAEAEAAFAALDTLLGNSEWFWALDWPGLFDASVFAYVGLVLDENLGSGWSDGRLAECVQGKQGLQRHREEILRRFWGRR